MTVADLHDRMSNAEFVQWSVFYGRKGQRQQMADLKAKRGKGRR